MDELEIYGWKRARCPDTGEWYHKRALDMLSVERPRRKTAVAMTWSADIEALVQRNCLASPLLRLPHEIREKILRHLLGNQTVHVQFVQDDQDVGVEGGSLGVIGKLRHAICVAKVTESEAYAQATHGYGTVPSSDSARQDITCCTDRHNTCYFASRRSGLRDVPPSQKYNLAALGACRQLCDQAHDILLTTNTFSFDDPVSFGKFMASLNIVQLHKSKSLHLSRLVNALPADRIINHWAWTIACEPPRIKVLRGLHTLHVCLEQRCIQQDAQPFLQLRILALAHVTVVVADRPALILVPAARWTAAEKNEMAEEIRCKLLDPEGAASLKVEEEAKKLELEGWRLDKRDGEEQRKKSKENRVKEEKIRKEQAEQARAEAIKSQLGRQIGGAVRRSWMK